MAGTILPSAPAPRPGKMRAPRDAGDQVAALPDGYQRGPASGEILSDDVAGELARYREMREAMRDGRPPAGGER